jgi:hypothetical protein
MRFANHPGGASMTAASEAPATSDPRDYDYSRPSLSCDIVMKGGITSGVVYPQGICELAVTYRLRNVGGTSAGAIAAALAAAAEFGRARGGFAKLAALPHWIGARTNLQSLLQPQRGTRPLFRLLLAAIGRGWMKPLRLLVAAVIGFPIATILGLAPGVLLVVAGQHWGHGGALRAITIACGIVLMLLGFAVALVAAIVRRLTRKLPENYFGLCSGNSPTDAARPALTPWLADELDRFARGDDDARSEPLTFGELWAGPSPAAPEAGERWLNLEMMTTNLTNRRPERLPWASSRYFYDPRQFADLFPPRVVDWLREHPPAEPDAPADRRDWRLRCALMAPRLPLPDPADLPVILPTRLSLSFPLLLSAVPLWTIDMSRKRNQEALANWREYANGHDGWEEVLKKRRDHPELADELGFPEPEICWFSDGGISSNFPIQFFDAPLPRWPTFGVNLRPFHPDYPRSTNEADNVYMPKSNSGGILEWWYRFPRKAGPLAPIDGRVAAFLSAVVRTMQNRVDEAQMRMPGYRDRVAHVGTDPEEGGMNLTMKPDVLRRLNERGRLAGVQLSTRFATPAGDGTPLTWANHRWVRYRSSFAALAGLLRKIARGYDGVERPDDTTYADLVVRSDAQDPDSYRWRRTAQRQFAAEATTRIIELEQWAESNGQTLAEGAPQPAPEARIAPTS